MSSKPLIRASCAVLIAAAAAPLGAHECSAAPSNELIAGLFGRSGGGVSLVHGALPDELRTSLLLPAGARIVGSAVQEEQTSVVAVVPLAGVEARRAIETALTKKYWVAPPDEAPEEGGFVSSEVSRGFMFCGEKGEVLSGWLGKHPDGTLVTLHYAPSARGECGRSRRSYPRAELNQLLPRLEPPETARVRGGGGGGSGSGDELGDTAHRTAVVETDLPPAELAELFASQLAAAGWQLDAVATGSVSTLQLWLFRGDQHRLIGELTTVAVGPGKVVASFKVTRAAAATGP